MTRPKIKIPISKEDLLCQWSIDLDSSRDYCVYLHYTKDTDELFYVGKGKGNRAYSSLGRNSFWKNIVNKHGYYVVKYFDFLNEEDAFLEEARIMEKYRPRANVGAPFLGGSGCQQQTKEVNEKRRIACAKYWTDEKKAKRSQEYSGINNFFYGKKHSKETKSLLKQYRYSPIECSNHKQNISFVVSGTREAELKTSVRRKIVDDILKNKKSSYKDWTFKRILK